MGNPGGREGEMDRMDMAIRGRATGRARRRGRYVPVEYLVVSRPIEEYLLIPRQHPGDSILQYHVPFTSPINISPARENSRPSTTLGP